MERANNRQLKITCPEDGCEKLLPPKVVTALLEEESVRYQRIVVQSYVDHDKGASWCPGTA